MAGTTISNSTNVSLYLTASSQSPVTVAPAGTIASANGFAIYGYKTIPWRITNDGLLASSKFGGIYLTGGGTVTNGSPTDALATILGDANGLAIGPLSGSLVISGSVANFGTIASTGKNGSGVVLRAGVVVNGSEADRSASIRTSSYNGVDIYEPNATVTSFGTIVSSGTGPQGLTGDGVLLQAGGTVTNGSDTDTAAYVEGGVYGVQSIGTLTGVISNFGTIAGGVLSTAGVDVHQGSVTNGSSNDSSAFVSGYGWGIRLGFGGQADGTVSNFGTVTATGPGSSGVAVALYRGGTLINGAASNTTAIIAGSSGARLAGHHTVQNFGTISGTGDVGLAAGGPGTVTNGSVTDTAATIESAFAYGSGVELGPSVLANFGSIRETGTGGIGLALKHTTYGTTGTVTNGNSIDHGAVISGGTFGILVATPGTGGYGNDWTISNWGTVSASDGSGAMFRAGSHLVNGDVTDPDALISGSAYGVNVHAFGTNAAGQPSNVNSMIANFGTIQGKVGIYFATYTPPSYSTPGNGYSSGTLINAGAIISTDGPSGKAVELSSGPPGSPSVVVVHPGAVFIGTVQADTLELVTGSSSGTINGVGTQFMDFQTINIDPGADWMIAGNAAGLGSATTINGFSFGDTIQVAGLTESIVAYSGGTLSLGGDLALDLSLPGAFTTASFTRIRTERGVNAVERLRQGDRVVTASGAARQIVWIGHRHIDCRQHPRPQEIWPICVRAGAFRSGLPQRDLRLSPDHAVLVDGVLIPIRYLVNGRTIVRERVTEMTYFHVELATHDVILAEGLPCETYLDTGDHSNFDNCDGPIRLFPDFSIRSQDACALWEERGYARLVVTGPELAAVRRKLEERSWQPVSVSEHGCSSYQKPSSVRAARDAVARTEQQQLGIIRTAQTGKREFSAVQAARAHRTATRL